MKKIYIIGFALALTGASFLTIYSVIFSTFSSILNALLFFVLTFIIVFTIAVIISLIKRKMRNLQIYLYL